MSQSLWQRLFNHRQPNKQAVLILGSGRSGTSVMTKCINLMGISLGTDNLLAPSKRINPKGYFENKDVINIHKSLGSRIRYRPAFKGYYDSPKIKKDRAALTTYLQTFFENEQYLAIKDPRMNDYIELWQHVLADVEVLPAEIVLLRNPMDVVNSNERAWHRDTTLAMRQWQVRTLLSLRDTDRDHRILVTYEDLFGQTLATLKRIATQFDLPWTNDEAALQAQIDDFIDPALQKSDSGESLADFEARTDVDPDVKALYLLGRQAAADPAYFASAEFQQRIDDLTNQYLAKYGALYRDFNVKINSKTFFVFGEDQVQVDQVNGLLEDGQVKMVGTEADSHVIAEDLSERLNNNTLAVQTYPLDYLVVEQKEALNNYLRKNAKRETLWGVGDAQNNEIVEMLTTVSAELGADTHNVVIADDLTTIDDRRTLRLVIQHLVRTVHAVEQPPYLVLMADQLDIPATQTAIAAFIAAEPTKEQPVHDSQPDETFKLRTPLDLNEAAATLTALCQRASQDEQQQAALNHFVSLNYDEILNVKGDQYANSVRN
ncbi:sulfotransferase family protein [Lactiplantibacillus paraplantarum]|uniref:sulfotransferase family protein n=1 Tax=Lactiplantibacillus paraplantarum TaxID=60520 RepID=UPI003DA69BF9